MKNFSVSILFKNGEDFKFESVDNPMLLQPKNINGAEMIMTRDQFGINLQQVEEMKVVEIAKG